MIHVLDRDAANWVDRGQPVEIEIVRLLAVFLELDPDGEGSALRPHAVALLGMVQADASEAQLAGYLNHVETTFGQELKPGPTRVLTAAAVWHAAKVALVRDRLVRLAEHVPADALRAQGPSANLEDLLQRFAEPDREPDRA